MATEISCVRFLNAIAAKISNMYEFGQSYAQRPAFDDVLRAKESKTWGHRKIPRTEELLDASLCDNHWTLLKKLSNVIADRLRSTDLLGGANGKPYILLPNTVYFSEAERVGVAQIAVQAGLVATRSELVVRIE